VLEGVDWTEYSDFLRAFAERPGFRLTYDEGTLEITSPRIEHEDDGWLLGHMVAVLTQEFDLPLKPAGSTTLRRRLKQKGIEADESFWIQSAHRMRGRRSLDLRRDPPPDLAIEIDVTSSCLNRLAIYAALRVPEIWRLEGDTLEFLVLQSNGKYRKVTHSEVFPKVTPANLMRFVLPARRAPDCNPIILDFRKWVRGLK
jgi:Uma2 family endonuclease